jgi:coenzyme F420-0:L-glutamate ligase/coenzyme F420-1:gamma-L-glutamate ligase
MNYSFDLIEMADELVGETAINGDILVVSSKFIAISEGRIVFLDQVKASNEAKRLSQKYDVVSGICELILRESDEIVGGVPGFILTIKSGLMTPNAGIDRSNIDRGKVVLYPRRPLESAQTLRKALRFRRGVTIGIVVSDSRLMPTRKGTTGVALAASGLKGLIDLRGKTDLFGNVLRVTSQAIADDLCSTAQLVMGESDESIPLVLIRGLNTLVQDVDYSPLDFAIPSDRCVYVRGMSGR